MSNPRHLCSWHNHMTMLVHSANKHFLSTYYTPGIPADAKQKRFPRLENLADK